MQIHFQNFLLELKNSEVFLIDLFLKTKEAEKFCRLNRAPVFLTENISLKGKPFELGKDKEHIKLNLTQDKKTVFSSIGFWFTSKFSLLEKKSNFSAAYTIEENNWKDRTTIQLNLKDLK